MREIKFKLWHKRIKQMYYYEPKWGNYEQGGGWVGGVLMEDYKKEGRTFHPSNQMQLEPESCEWLQFTGLLDKHDKEIYEGDILRTLEACSDTEYETGKVYWAESSAGFYLETEISNDELSAFIDGEVIGNIYENPELLES